MVPRYCKSKIVILAVFQRNDAFLRECIMCTFHRVFVAFSKKKKKKVGLCAKRKDKRKPKGRNDFIKHLWAEARSHHTGQGRLLLPFNFDDHAVDIFILK